jgi:hypothetical protein
MFIHTDALSRRPVPHGALPSAAAVLFSGWCILAACSQAPSDASPSLDVASLPNGGLPADTADTPLSPVAPMDAMGVYPIPEVSSANGTAVPKAVPHAAGTNAVFLPAVINEKPPLYPFEVQQTGVLAIQGFFGCDWTGAAGQVFDPTGDPIQNLILHLEGYWNGSPVSAEVLSGSATQYGPAGYEFLLGNQPLASTQTLWIQLLDAAHKQISARVYFNTFNDCAHNLILINFVEILR